MRLLVEGRDLDVDDVAFEPRLDRVDADHVAHDLDVERLVLAPAHDRQGDRRVDGPAHLLDRLLERQPDDLLAVEMRDQVVGLQAGLGRRRVVDRRNHLDDAVLHRHLDAEPAELALGLHLHVAEVLRVEVGGVRIERRQHAVDGRVDQHAVVGLLDVVGAHALQHVAEQVELLVDLGVGGGRRVGPGDVEHGRGAGEAGQHHESPEREVGFARHPCTFREASDHQGSGSIGRPSLRNSMYRTGPLSCAFAAARLCQQNSSRRPARRSARIGRTAHRSEIILPAKYDSRRRH